MKSHTHYPQIFPHWSLTFFLDILYAGFSKCTLIDLIDYIAFLVALKFWLKDSREVTKKLALLNKDGRLDVGSTNGALG